MKCPLHTNMAGEFFDCNPECAWLMSMSDNPSVKACSEPVKASEIKTPLGYFAARKYVLPANVVQEGVDG